MVWTADLRMAPVHIDPVDHPQRDDGKVRRARHVVVERYARQQHGRLRARCPTNRRRGQVRPGTGASDLDSRRLGQHLRRALPR